MKSGLKISFWEVLFPFLLNERSLKEKKNIVKILKLVFQSPIQKCHEESILKQKLNERERHGIELLEPSVQRMLPNVQH